ncbi:CsgE family curli-type amyloid fiber assembly protein [Bacteroidota bacterium]
MRGLLRNISGLLLLNILLGGVLFAQELKKPDSTAAVVNINEIPTGVRKIAKALDQLKEQKIDKEPDLEIDGLVVDETKTKMGREFYNLFFNNWNSPENAKNFTIIVQELPYRGTNTQMVVNINESIVYQAVLQPRSEYLEQMVGDLINRATQYLINYQAILESMESEDMSGTGIY